MTTLWLLAIMVVGVSCAPREQCEKNCAHIYNPVCGSDGRNYLNPCLFTIADCVADGALELRELSFCSKRATRGTEAECAMACSKVYRPVCGSDGRLHSNQCTFEVDQCMSDNKLKHRDMSFCTGKHKHRRGIQDCWKACPGTWDPVCDSNGIRYSNFCDFQVTQCMSGGQLSLAPCP